MASSPITKDQPEGSSVEIVLVVTGLLVGLVMVAGTFAPELLPWVNGVVNDIADQIGFDF